MSFPQRLHSMDGLMDSDISYTNVQQHQQEQQAQHQQHQQHQHHSYETMSLQYQPPPSPAVTAAVAPSSSHQFSNPFTTQPVAAAAYDDSGLPPLLSSSAASIALPVESNGVIIAHPPTSHQLAQQAHHNQHHADHVGTPARSSAQHAASSGGSGSAAADTADTPPPASAPIKARRGRPANYVGGMDSDRKIMEICALREIGFEPVELTADDLSSLTEPKDLACLDLYRKYLVKLSMHDPALRKAVIASGVKNEFTGSVLVQVLASLYACSCGRVKYGQKLKALQHIAKKHSNELAGGGIPSDDRLPQSQPHQRKERTPRRPHLPQPAEEHKESPSAAASSLPFDITAFAAQLDPAQYAAFAAAYAATHKQPHDDHPDTSLKDDSIQDEEEHLPTVKLENFDNFASSSPFSVQPAVSTTLDSAEPTTTKVEPPAEPTCSQCGSSSGTLFQCSACLSIVYCSAKCQKNHWKVHKKECGKSKEELEAMRPKQPEVQQQPAVQNDSQATESAASSQLPETTEFAPLQSHPATILHSPTGLPGPISNPATPLPPLPVSQSLHQAPASSSSSAPPAAAGATPSSLTKSTDPDALYLELQIWKDEALRLRRDKVRKRKAEPLDSSSSASASAAATAALVPVATAAMEALAEWRRVFGAETPQEALKMWQRITHATSNAPIVLQDVSDDEPMS